MRVIDYTAEGNILGRQIREARRNAGLSQQELGRKIGLGKSGISKIESGKTRISFEDASMLLEVMGYKMNLSVDKEGQMLQMQGDILRFSRSCVVWFSQFKGVGADEAFRIMMESKALTFLKENYRYESTLPKDTIIEDIDNIVRRNTTGQSVVS